MGSTHFRLDTHSIHDIMLLAFHFCCLCKRFFEVRLERSMIYISFSAVVSVPDANKHQLQKGSLWSCDRCGYKLVLGVFLKSHIETLIPALQIVMLTCTW